jgi:Na+-driven multidrug efflux pump
VLMFYYFHRLERYVVFSFSLVPPQLGAWKRIFAVGSPPGGEFALLFIYLAVIYWAIRGFGADAQAGFGVASRIMQAIFFPALAIAFATAPVAGQNMGAGKLDRVRASFNTSVMMTSGIMLLLTVICQLQPALLIAFFTDDPEVIDVGAGFLKIISFNFVASGIIFTCSGMFQAMENTLPSLAASSTRLFTFVIPAVWLSYQPWFELPHLWYLSVFTVAFHAVAAWWLLAREMNSRLRVVAGV